MPSAARVAWAKFRVLTVAVVSLLILGALLYEMFGGALFASKSAVYLYIPDASGLDEQSPVRVDGIDVGRVSRVELTGDKQPDRAVKVTLRLFTERLHTIPTDSVTQISSDSLVGDKFVDISSGASPKTVAPGGELNYKNQPELLRSLDLTQFTSQLRLLDDTLRDIEEGRSQMGQFVQGEEFYNDVEKRLKEVDVAFQDAVRPDTLVGGLLKSDDLYRQLTGAAEQMDQAIARIQSGQGAAGQLLHNSAQYDQLVQSTRDFRKTVQTMAENPLLRTDEAYASLDQQFKNLIRQVDEFNRNPLLLTSSVYENLNGSMQELRDTLHDFRTNPRKYLRLKIF